jgi:hypothetical protein
MPEAGLDSRLRTAASALSEEKRHKTGYDEHFGFMNCRQVEEQEISHRCVQGDLEESERQEFEAHSFECLECYNRVRTLQDVQVALKSAPVRAGRSVSRRSLDLRDDKIGKGLEVDLAPCRGGLPRVAEDAVGGEGTHAFLEEELQLGLSERADIAGGVTRGRNQPSLTVLAGTQIPAEKRHDVVLKPNTHGAGVGARVDFERVDDAVGVENIMQLARVDA